jgi:hypothetical protein
MNSIDITTPNNNNNNKMNDNELSQSQSESDSQIIQEPVKCYICYDTTNTDENLLVSPCICTGTMGKVHQMCIKEWVQNSKDTNCPNCKTELTKVTKNSGFISENKINFINKWFYVFTIGLLFFTFLYIGCCICICVVNYFIFSPMTLIKLAMYKLTIILVFTLMQRLQIRVETIEYDGTKNKKICSLINIFIDIMVTRYHVVYTGWTLPVMLMCGSMMLETFIVISNRILEWYEKKYFKTIFVNKN